MRVGILGSGVVGQKLGIGFAALGHDVRLGTREPGSDKVKAWTAEAGGTASAGTFAQAAEFGEVAVIATAWSGTESAIQLAGPANLAGKVVVDVTNPLDFSGGAPRLALGFGDSAGERVQRWLPQSRVVKAFNTVNANHMFKPALPGGPPDMFICGNDEGAKRTVAELCRSFGWNVDDLGGIEAARLLEPLAMVYITHAIRSGSWDIAFKLLRK